MTQQAPQGRPRARRGQGLQMLAFGVFIAGMIFALPTMLVLTLGLLPTLVALVVDLHPRKYAARCVGTLNFAGVMPFLVQMWTDSHSLYAAMEIITDLYAWFVIYSASALGWVCYLSMPWVAGLLLEINTAHRIRRLEARQKHLVAEWGEEVKGEEPKAAKRKAAG